VLKRLRDAVRCKTATKVRIRRDANSSWQCTCRLSPGCGAVFS